MGVREGVCLRSHVGDTGFLLGRKAKEQTSMACVVVRRRDHDVGRTNVNNDERARDETSDYCLTAKGERGMISKTCTRKDST